MKNELYHYGIPGMKWGGKAVSERRWVLYCRRAQEIQ
nr:MAG TPA: hypothetical protein [Caudoviricetes sp.]